MSWKRGENMESHGVKDKQGGGGKEVEGNSEFLKKMASMLWNLIHILFHNIQIKGVTF